MAIAALICCFNAVKSYQDMQQIIDSGTAYTQEKTITDIQNPFSTDIETLDPVVRVSLLQFFFVKIMEFNLSLWGMVVALESSWRLRRTPQ